MAYDIIESALQYNMNENLVKVTKSMLWNSQIIMILWPEIRECNPLNTIIVRIYYKIFSEECLICHLGLVDKKVLQSKWVVRGTVRKHYDSNREYWLRYVFIHMISYHQILMDG